MLQFSTLKVVCNWKFDLFAIVGSKKKTFLSVFQNKLEKKITVNPGFYVTLVFDEIDFFVCYILLYVLIRK